MPDKRFFMGKDDAVRCVAGFCDVSREMVRGQNPRWIHRSYEKLSDQPGKIRQAAGNEKHSGLPEIAGTIRVTVMAIAAMNLKWQKWRGGLKMSMKSEAESGGIMQERWSTARPCRGIPGAGRARWNRGVL